MRVELSAEYIWEKFGIKVGGKKPKVKSLKRKPVLTNEERLEKARVYRKNNRDRIRQSARNFYLRNTEKIKKAHSEYRKKNPEKKAGFASTWRSRRYGGNLDPEDVKKAAEMVRNLKSGLFGTCSYCAKELAMNQMTIDHIKPLAKGGQHVAENLALACRPCNSSKNDKILGEQWGNIPQITGEKRYTRTGSNRKNLASSRNVTAQWDLF